MIDLVRPQSPQDWLAARELVDTYARSLAVDLSFQNFARELEQLPVEYGGPCGAFRIARERGLDLGCVGVRRFSDEAGEIKRLYVAPAARGRGVGRLLALAIVADAKSIGYKRLLLDTLPSMTAAQGLYAALGFEPVEAYRFNPLEGAQYMELVIS